MGVNPSVGAGETFGATQSLCPDQPSSGEGSGTAEPCSSIPAAGVGPVQSGDDHVHITDSVPGALIRVYRNGLQVGAGSAPIVYLTTTVGLGDTLHIVQSAGGCVGQLAVQVDVPCVDPPIEPSPASLDIFPVGYDEYEDGPVRGSFYYPAADDGMGARSTVDFRH